MQNEKISKKCNLVFDFDGTLADSFSLASEKWSALADKYKFRKLNPHEVEILKDLSSRELIQYLKIPFYKLPFIVRHAREIMHSEMSFLPAFPHLINVLEELNNQNCVMGILTSNSLANVNVWLKQHKLNHLFNFIHTDASFFGKTRLLKKIIKANNMQTEQTFYIGDETRDIETAKRCKIHAIAVSWGFNSEKILLNYKPDYLARKPQDLLDIIKENYLLKY
ncbi:HAD-IA family hydrolase [Legionella sp. D16C41]|uniref:HAD-IA family hydrolase n=1 Tax=Legionella sp. D16C41 TaxID=3402688 RepID=UPI003AF9C23A